MTEAIQTVWKVASGDHGLTKRGLNECSVKIPSDIPGLSKASGATADAGRKAILDCVRESCEASLSDALLVQSKHSGEFIASKECVKGTIGSLLNKTMQV